ncbi:hypothetical protein DOTSEDRAFT_47803 [Dothistroma septosporum NZE10]|uniref:Uncharacterized protein n=1 Tax=Dothistroma septosporum (strain NZE10 / CBS 128990) TaxID=675120 RepID=M2Y1L7_DOTSN|nr:hypothetical protein DOTSEDRAFT_47803 [Dothistroma septosporum NZE10]
MSSQLLGLAPELRNMLYELAFTTDSQGPIDLCTLASPLTALLYTCHQIYSEALQLYHEVRNSYWCV